MPTDTVARADQFMRTLDLPPEAEVYRVGGSVRDEVLGRNPKDADYVVRNVPRRALADAVKAAGAKPTPLQLRDGRKVGVRANLRGLGLVEIALPRTERSTGPDRQDFEIITDPELDLDEDAERRDFTFNALYRGVAGNIADVIVDPTGYGRDDLDEGLIRTTHPDSFRDDPLRILRALRFLAVLPPRFELADETRDDIRLHADAVTALTRKGVSGTAFDELCKLLMGRRPQKGLRAARDLGVLATFLPELRPMLGFEQNSAYHDMTTDEHTFVALSNAAGFHLSLRVRLALLFHDSGKPASAWTGDDGRVHYYLSKDGQGADHELVGASIARLALKRLNAPGKLMRDVVTLIERHMVPVDGKTKATKVRTWRTELGDDLLEDLLKHRLCDAMGKGEVNYDHVSAIARLEAIREDAVRAHVPTSAKELPVDGHDLMALGLRGSQIGKVQAQLLHEVVSKPDRNDREWLIARAVTLAAKCT